MFDIAAIIPSYKQPGFLAEAIESVLLQQSDLSVSAVIVDDGCPFEQTRAVGLSFARRYPARVFYLRQANGGLSAARNTGVNFALAAFPACRSIYLLDADNRLHPHFLGRAQAVMDAAEADVGWVYPDFDFFGFEENYSARGQYSRFLHLLENYCEAGSLIRRSVFERGLRYDESMRSGFEDWDFWLRCGQDGFRGQYLPSSGFRYRKRAESMLASSERMRSVILGGMRIRYSKHLAVRTLAALEAREVPRFALFVADENAVGYVLDPVAAPHLAEIREDARVSFVESNRSPQSVHFPAFCCFSSRVALDLLTSAGLLRNVFYQAQIAMREVNCVAVTLTWSKDNTLSLHRGSAPVGSTAVEDAVIMFSQTNSIEEATKGAAVELANPPLPHLSGSSLSQISLVLPMRLQRDVPSASGFMQAEIDAMRRQMLTRSSISADWRSEWRRPRANAYEAFDELAGCGAIMPHLGLADGREVGFLLPLFEFGGVEKVVLNYAATLRQLGWRPHLFITGSNQISVLDGHSQVFESINFFDGEGIEGGDYTKLHSGACVSGFAEWRDTRDAVGLLSTMNVVLNTHALGGHGIMHGLRRQGVKTYLGLHLVEKGPLGQPLGNPHIALAYEGAYDGFVVISEKLRHWCIGQSVPEDKIFKVLNAPSYDTSAAMVARALLDRRTRKHTPLRVLYLGRLDAQKGLERLRDVVLQTTRSDFEWRLVGKAVLNDTALDLGTTGVVVEAPAMASLELDALYAWADVVVLPSRFEGVPLTILEAQRFGCVPVATDVGAVAEIIEDGTDGFLVRHDQSESEIVSEFCRILFNLSADPSLFQSVSSAAAKRVAITSWENNMRPWISELESHLTRAA